MKKVGLIFGGISNEAEVSIMSARNVVQNFDYSIYSLVLIFWGKDGVFYKVPSIDELRTRDAVSIDTFKNEMDVALLMTHGKFGEDGVLQGMLAGHQIPYCGSRVLGSALCMDKVVCKQLMKSAGIKQVEFLSFEMQSKNDMRTDAFIAEVRAKLPLPLFVKPANSGSSVGVSKVKTYEDLRDAILLAYEHDTKILVEQGLDGVREVEVAVLGNEELTVSDPGELLPGKEFYDYDDKYVLGKSSVVIPAQLPEMQMNEIRAMARQAYVLANCKGFARVDFFVQDGVVYLNEINTLPGFTTISMFPMLMSHAGKSYKELLNTIIELGY